MRISTATLLVGLLLLPSLAFAKRPLAPKVEPVVYEGVRYVAPNARGAKAVIEAWDVAAGKRLWQKTIFTTWINPLKEECNQWVFIKELRHDDGQIVISDERDRNYSLNVKTGRVRKLKA
jgi:hypothetical protein